MIIVGIGANLSHPDYGLPRRTCGAALSQLNKAPLNIIRRSHWYASAPILRDGSAPPPDQPWYVNGAIAVETTISPEGLLDVLQETELMFGRERSVDDAPRTLDLDVLAFHDEVINTDRLIVPHPRLHERAFALLPMADVAPEWRHPITGEHISTLVAQLGNEQGIERTPDAEGYMGTEWET